MGSHRPRPRAAAVAAAVALLAAAGCGEETRFSAEEFVKAVNREGAALALGPVLTTTPNGVAVHEVALTEVAPSATGEGPDAEVASGDATLLVFDGSGDAEDEFDRCDDTAALTCFRAANVVLRVEDLQPSDRARLTTAVEALGDEG